MIRPSLLVRFAGSPLGALVLFAACAFTIYGSFQGRFSFWYAAGAVILSRFTFTAIGSVREYKKWAADWEAIGTLSGDAPEKKRGLSWGGVGRLALAYLLAMGIPLYMAHRLSLPFLPPPPELFSPEHMALEALRGLALTYLAFWWARLAFLTVRYFIRRRKVNRAIAAEEAPVTWLLDCASSSPSRAEAEKELPEYCARLIARKQQGASLAV